MKSRTALVAFVAVVAAFATLAPPAGATSNQSSNSRPLFEVHVADLAPVPHSADADGGSNVTGKVAYIRFGDRLTILEFANGLAGNLPHAQHVHGIGGGACPGPDRAGDDGLIDTLEAAPDYGAVQVSLTTRGDTTASSALAVDRFPVANRFGLQVYGRVLKIGRDIPAEIAYNIEEYHTVVHGIDVNRNGSYDFDAGVSSLDPSLPLEATVPAACGEIN